MLEPFEWRGRRSAKDEWVLIDLHGTNRDPGSWGDADAFRPERSREQPIPAYNFIPQGGGEHGRTHRYPGEWISIEQMRTITHPLAQEMHHEVPEQDLSIDHARMPAAPKSRFVISKVLANTTPG